VTQWLQGARDGQQLALASTGNGAITAAITGQTVKGTVLLPDPANPRAGLVGAKTYTFEATPAQGQAGVFREDRDIAGKTYTAGWVRLPDGSVRGDVTLAGDGTAQTLIAPSDIQALFPPNPLSTTSVTKAPKPTRRCQIATAQYNLAYKQWDDSQAPPGDGFGPGSGTTFNNLSAALFNFFDACGVSPNEATQQ
jgi:hypothetical protein